MAITRIKNSTISNRTPKYNDVLAGLPFRPIIGTATDGGNGTSASVAFTGNNVANGTITYTALSSPGSFTGTGTASPITVSGLTAGTAYTFQVKAGNSLGDSAYSAASNSVTPVTPTSYESIASATVGSAGTVTFTSIPQTYTSLQIRLTAKDGDGANTADVIRLTFNGVGGTSYAYHQLWGNGSTASANQNATDTSSIRIRAANASTTSAFSAGIIDIHDYTSTTRNKTVRAFCGVDNNTASTNYEVALSSGLFMSTNAITSITLEQNNNSNFSTGTQFALYGIKGA